MSAIFWLAFLWLLARSPHGSSTPRQVELPAAVEPQGATIHGIHVQCPWCTRIHCHTEHWDVTPAGPVRLWRCECGWEVAVGQRARLYDETAQMVPPTEFDQMLAPLLGREARSALD